MSDDLQVLSSAQIVVRVMFSCTATALVGVMAFLAGYRAAMLARSE
jgi:hypothetical protein